MTSPDHHLRLSLALRVLRGLEFPSKLGLLDRLFGRALSAHGICWVRTAPGPIWKLDLANATHRWIVYGHYEGPALWNWVRARSSTIHTIVDSGANIGQTVMYFASLTPHARILAYEPGTAARAWLQECVTFNGLAQITIHSIGLGASPASAHLVDDGGAGRHGSWNKIHDSQGEPIELVTLDDELLRLGLETLDLWKLDMEGYEGFALRGASRAIAAGRIRAIYIETSGETGRGNLGFLATHGYRVHGIAPSGKLVTWNPIHDCESALCLAPK